MADEQPAKPESSIEERIAAIYDQPQETTEAPEAEQVEVEAETEEAVEESAPVEAAEDETETSEVESPPEFLEVDYNGKTYQVPPELKDALMLQSDYTQKTQEVSNQRSALDLQAQEFKQIAAEREFMGSIQDEQNQLAQLQMLEGQYDQLDWASMSTDEMVRTKHQMDLVGKERGKIMETLKEKQGKWLEERSKTHAQYLSKGKEYLQKTLGKWDEESVKSVGHYMINMGVPEGEVKALTNPLYVSAFYKAMQWDSLKAKQATTVKAAKDAPTIQPKATSRKMPDDVKDKLNFRKKLKAADGSQAKADIIQERLAKMYDGAR